MVCYANSGFLIKPSDTDVAIVINNSFNNIFEKISILPIEKKRRHFKEWKSNSMFK